MPQWTDSHMVCKSNVLRDFETELPTEAVDAIGIVGEANIGEDLARDGHPTVVHIESIQPIARMGLDRCAGRDKEPGLGMLCIHNTSTNVYMSHRT